MLKRVVQVARKPLVTHTGTHQQQSFRVLPQHLIRVNNARLTIIPSHRSSIFFHHDSSTLNATKATSKTTTTTATPPKQQSLIVRKAKAYYRLARLDKPIGTYLLLFPCLWSLAFADSLSFIPDPILMASFVAGAVLMRGAGCTVNDLLDRDIDSQVERTRDRPLASKELSVPEAIAFLGLQVSGAAYILISQFNPDTIIACTASLALVGLYPLMKRVTNWPQLVLGLTFNWGALVGYLAISGAAYYNPYITLPLYVAGIAWTLIYDTIYAHQDKSDDKQVGVYSTALYFGDGTRGRAILLAFAFVFFVSMLLAGYYGAAFDIERHSSYYLAVLLSTAHLVHQITSVNFASASDCAAKFKSNKYVGILMLSGIILGNFGKQQDIGKILKKKDELVQIGVHPDNIAPNEDIDRTIAMYKEDKETKNLSLVDKLRSVFTKLGLIKPQ